MHRRFGRSGLAVGVPVAIVMRRRRRFRVTANLEFRKSLPVTVLFCFVIALQTCSAIW